MSLNPKYGLAIKLVIAGIVIAVATYFGMDVTTWVTNFINSTINPAVDATHAMLTTALPLIG